MQRPVFISWLGGEPLAWRELPRLSQVLSSNYGLQLGVTTNGVALASAKARLSLLQHYREITISIDGLAEFHDRVRGQAGLFDRLRANVAQLRREDTHGRLRRRINTILMRDNVAEFPEFCQVMADWGFHDLTFNQLGGNERPEYFADHRLLPQQVERFAAQLPDLRRRMAARGLAIRASQRYLDRIRATTSGRQIAIEDCRPAAELLFIDVLGRISPCSFSSECYGVPIARLQTVAQFLELPQRFRELREKRRLAACNDCHATHVFDKFSGQEVLQAAEQPEP
jgi:sulfatase maturation enzyme AslB (radical SAM superfamily)